MSLDERATGRRVLVTGATGYVAGPLVQRLLEAGAKVHAAVRDPSNALKIRHLVEMSNGSPGSLDFFAANLLEPGSYDRATEGCEIVFHTASPFLDMSKISDPQKQFVEPALGGTINILDTVNRTSSVERVVLTSSAATMAGGPADMEKTGGVVGPASWNSVSSLENGPYLYSKTVAERKAWELAEAQDRWRLVSVNPGTVLGPGLGADPTSASFDRVRSLGDGTFKNGLPPVRFGMVDVRDVAEAHFRAAFVEAAHGRYLLAEKVYSFGDLAKMLKARFGDRWSFPENTDLPADFPFYDWDMTKSRDELGLVYRPVEPALLSMFQQLVDTGRMTPVQNDESITDIEEPARL